MVTVPAQYDPLIREMSNSTGIPYNVIAAQAQAESAFNPTAQSSAGALGWLQFLPSTYDAYAEKAGVGKGTEFNPADEAKVYDVFMGGLLQQEHGNLRNALAAYNAGPGNIKAGLGYADSILSQSGGNIKTTGALGNAAKGALGGLIPSLSISGILGSAFGDLRDIFERLGLILLGAALVLLGIHLLSGNSGSVSDTTTNIYQGKGVKGKGSPSKSIGGAAEQTGASKAIESAAVA